MNELQFHDLLPHLKSLSLIFEQRSAMLTQGSHLGRRKGFEDEMLEYRNYAPGDDLRYLDWKLLARSDKFYIREGYQKSLQKVYLWLDTSLSQRLFRRKFHIALMLQYALGYLLLRQNDQVSLLSGSSGLELAANNSSSDVIKLKNIAELILNAQADEKRIASFSKKNHKKDGPSLVDEFEKYLPKLAKNGKLIWFTDLYLPYNEIEAIIRLVKNKQMSMTVFHLLSEDDLSIFEQKKKFFSRYIDVETGQWLSGSKLSNYRQVWEAAVRRRMELFGGHKIPYLKSQIEEGPIKILSQLSSL